MEYTEPVSLESSEESAKSMYSQMEETRRTYLYRARDAAKLTLPMLYPPQGSNASTVFATPYQSVGARGVRNMAAKMVMALLPPNQPFFRYNTDIMALKKALQKANPQQEPTPEEVDKLASEMQDPLSKRERAIMVELEASTVRSTAFNALTHAIISGNGLLQSDLSGNLIRFFSLDSYVVKRDPYGNLLKIITCEKVSPSVLDKDIQAQINQNPEKAKQLKEKTIELYTAVCLEEDGKRWKVWQEVCDYVIPSTKGFFQKDKLPYIAIRFSKIDGEDYGRSYVEEYIGDLRSHEALSEAMVEGAAAMAKLIFMVKPNGTTKQKTLADAENCAIIQGSADEVTVLQTNKSIDLSVAAKMSESIEKRLEFAFLLNSAIQRNAERVTAEEIRAMIQEIETALGGTYSVFAQEFQLPLVRIIEDRMQRQGKLNPLPKNIVKPVIITGVDALGRGNDLNKLMQFVQLGVQMVGPQVFAQLTHPEEGLKRAATALGIDADGFVKTSEEIAQQNQQMQQQAAMQQLGPQAIKSGADLITKGHGKLATPQDAQAAPAPQQ